MRKISIVIILCLILAQTACTIKQNQLVIFENTKENASQPKNIIDWEFDSKSQEDIIKKNKEILQALDKDLVPLVISPDDNSIFAFKSLIDEEIDAQNTMVITGNMMQTVELYHLKSQNMNKKSLGKFLAIKTYQFNEKANQFAFIDGDDNVYIYDLETEQLQKVLEKYKYRTFNSISWSKDSRRLMFDNRMVFDIASKEFISIAVDSYTPFIKKNFNENIYITEMKNDKYEDILALYDFDNRSYTQIANGLYMDSDNINVLYTQSPLEGLRIVNLKTLESKLIEEGAIYSASILKSSGNLIYTTTNLNAEDDNRYLLVMVDLETMNKKQAPLCTPTYYLSPAEDKLFFISDYGQNKVSVSLGNFEIKQEIVKKDDKNVSKIKSVIIKMFQLDYGFNGDYESYEEKARGIYTNTYSPIPQEALNNKLTDFKRFNTPLPSVQKESCIPPLLRFDSLLLKSNSASINIGNFFINSMELVKIDNDWFITGFSTHPESKEVQEVRTLVQKHINSILYGKENEALKYWEDDESESSKNNRKIIENIIASKDRIKIEIGETELWAMSEPHRAESPLSATEARVKITIREGENISKYKIILSRRNKESFIIKSWDADPLSISQLF